MMIGLIRGFDTLGGFDRLAKTPEWQISKPQK